MSVSDFVKRLGLHGDLGIAIEKSCTSRLNAEMMRVQLEMWLLEWG